MASGDRYNDGSSKAQTGYETTNTQGGGGNQTQSGNQQLAGIADHLEREFGSEPWYNSAVNQIVPLFRQLKQAQGDTVCLEQHGPNVSIMKQRQTSQGSQSR